VLVRQILQIENMRERNKLVGTCCCKLKMYSEVASPSPPLLSLEPPVSAMEVEACELLREISREDDGVLDLLWDDGSARERNLGASFPAEEGSARELCLGASPELLDVLALRLDEDMLPLGCGVRVNRDISPDPEIEHKARLCLCERIKLLACTCTVADAGRMELVSEIFCTCALAAIAQSAR